MDPTHSQILYFCVIAVGSCPWVGTAIGARNMFWFRTFVCMVPVCILYAVVVNMDLYGLATAY